MIKYLCNRPMIIAAIMCCFISYTAFFRPELLIAEGILILFLVAVTLKLHKRPTVVFALLVGLLVCMSSVISVNNTASVTKLCGKRYDCEFVVNDITYKGNSFQVAVIEVFKGGEFPKNTRISVIYNENHLEMGQVARADILVKSIKKSNKENLYSNGIFLEGELENIRLIEGKEDFVLKTVGKLRNYISKTAFSKMGYNSAATFCGLIYGEKEYFTEEQRGNIVGAGVSHVMVVSGMHLAIILSVTTILIEKFFYNKYVKAAIVLLAVLIMTALCGFTMSILRAGITYILFAISLLINRTRNSESLLATAVVVIIFCSPFAMLSMGFRLSVMSTFGILSVALPINDYVKRDGIIPNPIGRGLFGAVTITLSATLFTMPTVIYEIGALSTVTVLSNLLVSLAVTALIWVAAIGLALNLVSSTLALPFFNLCNILLKYLNSVINGLGSLPFSLIKVPTFTVAFAYLIIIVAFWILLTCKRRENVLKLKKIYGKIIKEGGKRVKWR